MFDNDFKYMLDYLKTVSPMATYSHGFITVSVHAIMAMAGTVTRGNSVMVTSGRRNIYIDRRELQFKPESGDAVTMNDVDYIVYDDGMNGCYRESGDGNAYLVYLKEVE